MLQKAGTFCIKIYENSDPSARSKQKTKKTFGGKLISWQKLELQENQLD